MFARLLATHSARISGCSSEFGDLLGEVVRESRSDLVDAWLEPLGRVA